MASTQPAWSGHTNENQNSRVRGRPISDNRAESERVVDKPKIESFQIHAGLASPDIAISIVADGKNYWFRGNRRTLMKVLAQAAEGAFKMEPGK